MKTTQIPPPGDIQNELPAAIETIPSEERQQESLHGEILHFALTHGGTDLDLDAQLESASLNHLRNAVPRKKR